MPAARNRPLLLGAVWGLALAVVPALVMTDPYQLTGFLVVTFLCAAVSGVVGTLVAGGRTFRRTTTSARKGTRGAAALRGLGIGAVQGIVGGALAALLFWAVMALTISGFTLRDPVELSAFVYTLVGGLLLGPSSGRSWSASPVRRYNLYAKLLGFGAVYGFGFTLIKSLFPTPVILLFAGGDSTEGNLTTLASVYMLSGLLAGIIGGPIFGAFLLRRRGSMARAGMDAPPGSGTDLGKSLTLSFAFAIFIGLISTLLTMAAYGFGLLPAGGVLDPLTLIRSSNFSPGTPLLVAWTFARDMLPAMLAGLFLSPLGGGFLYRVYAAGRPVDTTPSRSSILEDEF